MRNVFLLVTIATFVLLVSLAARSFSVQPAVADDDGDRDHFDESIEGSWGFSAQGTVLPPFSPAAAPAVAVGTLLFDGEGGCSITDTSNIGGFIIGPHTSEICSYSVNSDGTGALTVAFPGDTALTPISFVVLDRGREIRTIRTDFGVATGVARRQ